MFLFFFFSQRFPPLAPFLGAGIDNPFKICYILYVKSCDEDTRSGRASQREIQLGARVLYAPRNDTTSEPSVGNSRSGAPVIVPMSGGAIRNQGGTVEYLCIPPLIFSGDGYFLYLPQGFPLMGSWQKSMIFD